MRVVLTHPRLPTVPRPRRDGERRLRAEEFWAHLLLFAGANALLWAGWALAYPLGGMHFPWPVFPLVGWGIGLAYHAWRAFGPRSR